MNTKRFLLAVALAIVFLPFVAGEDGTSSGDYASSGEVVESNDLRWSDAFDNFFSVLDTWEYRNVESHDLVRGDAESYAVIEATLPQVDRYQPSIKRNVECRGTNDGTTELYVYDGGSDEVSCDDEGCWGEERKYSPNNVHTHTSLYEDWKQTSQESFMRGEITYVCYDYNEANDGSWAWSWASKTFSSKTVDRPVCQADWEVSEWSTCSYETETQTREVTDANECDPFFRSGEKPNETRSCTPSCTPDWDCGAWSTCSLENETQTRSCVDLNTCPSEYRTEPRPNESRSCTPECSPDWNVSSWGSCTEEGLQYRNVSDLNDCPSEYRTEEKPDTQRSCEYTGDENVDENMTDDGDEENMSDEPREGRDDEERPDIFVAFWNWLSALFT